MKGTRAALRYAKALLSLAKEKSTEKKVNKDMELIISTIKESDELQVMLNNPVIKITDKKNILEALFSEKSTIITTNLFTVLEENKRMNMLVDIAKQYILLYNKSNEKQVAEVTTAIPLTKTLEEKIITKIIALTGNSASIENKIDSSIIGGFILRIGDLQYDASISNQFNELKKEFDKSH